LEKYKNLPIATTLANMPSSSHVDNHLLLICDNATEETLNIAANELWNFRVYPKSVLFKYYSDFAKENRPMREGDLVCQRVWVIPYIIESLCINRIAEIIDLPNKKGFTYAATPMHDEIGQMTCTVELEDDKLFLKIHCVSALHYFLPPASWFGRWLQLRAHRTLQRTFPETLRTAINKLKQD
jgi:uncharacterized protein (UPF0548 family)